MTITFKAKHKSGFTVDVLEPFTFPAGEAHIKGFDTLNVDDYDYFFADVRGHDPQDLFHLAMWSNGLDSSTKSDGTIPRKYLILPYIPGARADRGVPFGAQVYAQFINSLFLDKVIVLDPHSPVAPGLFENPEKADNKTVVEFPFERIIRKEIQDGSSDQRPRPYVGVIAPDAGAVKRANRAARVMGVPVYAAGKTRDFQTGKLAGFHMNDALPTEGKFLIVDDICDGGGTFIGLAEAIKKDTPNVELDLWVTHGVFSNPSTYRTLLRSFGAIHTTNSYQTEMGRIIAKTVSKPTILVFHDTTPYLYAEVHNQAVTN